MQQTKEVTGGIPDDRYEIPETARTPVFAGVRARWLFAKPTLFHLHEDVDRFPGD